MKKYIATWVYDNETIAKVYFSEKDYESAKKYINDIFCDMCNHSDPEIVELYNDLKSGVSVLNTAEEIYINSVEASRDDLERLMTELTEGKTEIVRLMGEISGGRTKIVSIETK
jgi:succinate dehydrogenase/fumarate reductase-like Fe-S protein